MTFESEYEELQLNSDLNKRREYWEIGKGLQKIDGLDTSEYLESVIEDTLTGKYDTEQASQKVKKYYDTVPESSPEQSNKEADMVATRITLLLETAAFKFSPVTLLSIHGKLFQDVLPESWVGKYREVNLTKSEDVLNGNTVQYADYKEIQELLRYDFEREKSAKYSIPFTREQVKELAEFTSAIWQTHPVREGNTRSIASFIMLYLQNLGISINNEPFMNNAQYFRDALVRSNYSNIQKGIYPNWDFLNMFFENISMDAGHDLEAQDLRCFSLFEID